MHGRKTNLFPGQAHDQPDDARYLPSYPFILSLVVFLGRNSDCVGNKIEDNWREWMTRRPGYYHIHLPPRCKLGWRAFRVKINQTCEAVCGKEQLWEKVCRTWCYHFQHGCTNLITKTRLCAPLVLLHDWWIAFVVTRTTPRIRTYIPHSMCWMTISDTASLKETDPFDLLSSSAES